MDDANFSECKFSSDIVPYMYGEIAGPERSAFESHLLGCSSCTDEFAAISSARYEVYDWKKLEFDHLETPYFEIPLEDHSAESAAGLVEKLRAAFAIRWVIPGVAFAVLAIVSVFAIVFVSSGSEGRDVAATIDNSSSDRVDIASEPSHAEPREVPVIENSAPRQPAPVRVSQPLREEQRRSVRNVRLVQPRTIDTRQASTQSPQKNVPRLNGSGDEEDTSLRLAELFDDVETRE